MTQLMLDPARILLGYKITHSMGSSCGCAALPRTSKDTTQRRAILKWRVHTHNPLAGLYLLVCDVVFVVVPLCLSIGDSRSAMCGYRSCRTRQVFVHVLRGVRSVFFLKS